MGLFDLVLTRGALTVTRAMQTAAANLSISQHSPIAELSSFRKNFLIPFISSPSLVRQLICAGRLTRHLHTEDLHDPQACLPWRGLKEQPGPESIQLYHGTAIVPR
jgi:hypothetical protein